MDWNKDEAITAKQIALQKMVSNDFEGARRIALKAQRLDPEIENIGNLLSVCDVHCSALTKVVGSEKDWYGILQAEKLVDESTVRKQYRRLALVLHPDKNQFPGAEAAFKMIYEANTVLSNPVNKSLYDNKIRGSVASSSVNHPPSPKSENYRSPDKTYNGFEEMNRRKTSPSTFWTICTSCRVEYEYQREYINLNLRCASCLNAFMAYESPHGDPTKARQVPVNRGGNFSRNGNKRTRENMKNKSRKKGRKFVMELSDSSDSSSDFDASANENIGNPTNDGHPLPVQRRSSRTRKNVSYCEGSSLSEDNEREVSEGAEYENAKSGGNDAADPIEIESDLDDANKSIFQCPDSEFNDFDKDREESCFAANQFWACRCYDAFDTMPRFYAKVKKVSHPFELLVTWLEPVPFDESCKKWIDRGLPVGCGAFKLGNTERTSLRFSFSHQMRVYDVKKGGSITIYPRKREVWALFEDSDPSSSSNPGKHEKYNYKIVEVLSDFDKLVGVKVGHMEEVGGLVSLFERSNRSAEGGVFLVGPNEIYKFSHRIPYCRMRGTEKEGLQVGSFELNPAALPIESDLQLWSETDSE